MDTIEIVVNDWMTSMGAVALMRLDAQSEYIKEDANKMTVSIEWLQKLPEILFDYIISHYSVATKETQKIQDWLNNLANKLIDKEKNKERIKNYKDWINKGIKNNIDKVIKYFPETVEPLQKHFADLKKALVDEELETAQQQFSEISKFLKQKDVDQKLTLNWVKSIMLEPSVGQASFVNVTKNSFSFEEQKKIFEKDYIIPILWEQQLRENFDCKDEEAIEQLFEIDKKPEYASKWKTAKKKSKLSWCEWLSQLPDCTLIEGQLGTMPFEEKHFVPLAMSVSNAYNYAWDGNIEAVQSISSLAKLLLFLSPLGATRYSRPYKGETIQVFGFLNNDSSCYATFELNNQLSNAMKKDGHFSEAVRDSFHKFKDLEQFRNKATVLIEWDTEYKAKKTILEYKVLNPNFVDLMLSEKYGKRISNIYPYAFREEIVRAALDNVDSKYVIIKEMRRIVEETSNKRITLSIKHALLVREYFNTVKGDHTMETEKTLTIKMHELGENIAEKLIGNSKKGNQEGHYQAPDEKKLIAVAYRLLNAAKAGNRQLFFDTAVRLHIQAGMNIGKTFTKSIDSSTSDKEFATIALAFIAGLIPSENDKKQETKNEI